MREIDEMELLGFLRVRAWNAKKKQEKEKPRRTTIDTVWPGLKPCVDKSKRIIVAELFLRGLLFNFGFRPIND